MSYARNLARLARSGAPTVDTAQDLRDLPIYGGLYPEGVVTMGSLARADGGGGLWYWDADSIAADTTGTVLLPTGHTGAGRWLRDYSAAPKASWFVGAADGTVDVSTALQTALDLGEGLVFDVLCGVSAGVTSTADGVTFSAEDGGGVALLSTPTVGLQVEGDHCRVYGVHFVGPCSDNGAGLVASLRVLGDDCAIRDCLFESHKWGLTLYDCSRASVTQNRFISATYPEGATHSTAGWDIAAYSTVASDQGGHVISGNHCASGSSVAIGLQTLATVIATDTGSLSNCVITDNYIDGAHGYGIMLYRRGDVQQLTGCVIANNHVRNIIGDLINATNSELFYGCAIYLQGAEDFIVDGNWCEDYAQETEHDSHAPCGVGIVNGFGGVVSSNRITGGGRGTNAVYAYGIKVADSNQFGTNNRLIITNNDIDDVLLDGILVATANDVYIHHNRINADRYGIYTRTLTSPSVIEIEGLRIESNEIRACGDTGIYLRYCKAPVVRFNKIRDCTANPGIYALTTTDAKLLGNEVNNCKFGIYLAADATGCHVDDNECTNCTTYGFYLLAVCSLWRNRAEDNTTNNWYLTGPGGVRNDPYFRLADAPTTPSIGVASHVALLGSSSVTITDFTDVENGQEFEVWVGTSYTIAFSGATLVGNNNVDWSPGGGNIGLMRCRYIAGKYYCSVIN